MVRAIVRKCHHHGANGDAVGRAVTIQPRRINEVVIFSGDVRGPGVTSMNQDVVTKLKRFVFLNPVTAVKIGIGFRRPVKI